MIKRFKLPMLAGALALLIASPASAQNTVLDQNKVGAALAILFITDDGGLPVLPGGHVGSPALPIITSAIVTNTSVTDSVILHGEIISGDTGDLWTGDSFTCNMTPGETTQFVFSPLGAGSLLKTECSDGDAQPLDGKDNKSNPKNVPNDAQKGILWLTISTAAFPPGGTLYQNILEGKSVVFNFNDGTAYEVGAVPFQSPDPGMANFDNNWQFNGLELARFPESLTASFHAPSNGVSAAGTPVPGLVLRTTLILFVLDGRLSSTLTPNAEALLFFFNDDEEFFDTNVSVDCFRMVDLETLDGRFTAALLGSPTGHLEIIPQSVDPADENHDSTFGDDDNQRWVGILGWIVQKLEGGAQIMDAQNMVYPATGNANDSAFGSLLSTSLSPLPNAGADIPTLRP